MQENHRSRYLSGQVNVYNWYLNSCNFLILFSAWIFFSIDLGSFRDLSWTCNWIAFDLDTFIVDAISVFQLFDFIFIGHLWNTCLGRITCWMIMYSFVDLGGREGFIFVEQWSHRESDKAKSKGYTAYHLPSSREEC